MIALFLILTSWSPQVYTGDYLLVYDMRNSEWEFLARHIVLMDFNNGVLMRAVVPDDAFPQNNEYTFFNKFPKKHITFKASATMYVTGDARLEKVYGSEKRVAWFKDHKL